MRHDDGIDPLEPCLEVVWPGLYVAGFNDFIGKLDNDIAKGLKPLAHLSRIVTGRVAQGPQGNDDGCRVVIKRGNLPVKFGRDAH
jgi:hypothetical protein